MTRILFFALFFHNCLISIAQKTGTEVLKSVHQKYYQAPCKCYSFSQKNYHYRNDSIVKTSVWQETIEFPDKFKIVFGDKADGNFVIFRNDSVVNYKKDQIIKSKSDSNSLLLILGGMFYRDWQDVEQRLIKGNYDLNILSVQKWNNRDFYVIGAKENDNQKNQIWIDKKTNRVKRIIEKLNQNDWMDMRFESHQDWCNGYVETKVSFRRNGVLEQVEEYFDLKIENSFYH